MVCVGCVGVCLSNECVAWLHLCVLVRACVCVCVLVYVCVTHANRQADDDEEEIDIVDPKEGLVEQCNLEGSVKDKWDQYMACAERIEAKGAFGTHSRDHAS